MTDWPYPLWIAHRGAGKQAPENTLAAFRQGAACGFRAFECDVKLSADDVPFLLHDATLERTTSGHGTAGMLPWSELATLDAGAWHSAAFVGATLPRLDEVAAYCVAHGHVLNIEIKPSPGTDEHTGQKVAQAAARLWHDAPTPPLLSSFSQTALRAARDTEPALPRALLLDTLAAGWLDDALALGCVAVVTNYRAMTVDALARIHQAGLRGLVYTVNEPDDVARLLAMGIDGIITDAVHRFDPARGRASQDR